MRCANRPRLSFTVALVVVLTLAWWPRTAAAHAEHYAQSAYLRLDLDHVTIELDLSPGSKVAGDVVKAIDENHDGQIDDAEGRVYAGVVRAALSLRVDGVLRPLRITEAHFPPATHLATGEDRLSLAFVAAFPALTPGPHQIQFSNGHHPVESVYLAHTFAEAKRVILGTQTRDAKNQELTAEFSVAASSLVPPATPQGPTTNSSVAASSLVRPRTSSEAGGPWTRLALGIGVITVLGASIARSRRRASPARIG